MLHGRTLRLRNATVQDADFIHALRTDELKSRHLSKVPPTQDAQIAWLQAYANRADEAYFVIEDLMESALGTVRLYNAIGDSFFLGKLDLAR